MGADERPKSPSVMAANDAVTAALPETASEPAFILHRKVPTVMRRVTCLKIPPLRVSSRDMTACSHTGEHGAM